MNEIRLGYINNKNYTFLDILNKEEFDKIIAATEVLNKYKFCKNLFTVFDTNFEEFVSYPPMILEQCVTDDNEEKGMGSYFNCNRLCINFLSSFRAYIDYVGSYLKKKYGHESEHIKSFERCMAFYFDKAFAYRFFYKLRNYSQHCGFPISIIRYSAKLNDSTEKINAELKVLFDRDELLTKYDSWGPVKKDLLNMPEEFDVMPLVYTLQHFVKDLAQFIDDIDRPSLTKSKEIIGELIKRINAPGSIACVFYDFKMSVPDSYENSTFSTLVLNEYLNF